MAISLQQLIIAYAEREERRLQSDSFSKNLGLSYYRFNSPQNNPVSQGGKMPRFKNLVSLAVDKENSLLNSDNLDPAIRSALAARKQKAGEQAAEELISLLDSLEQSKTHHRQRIRQYRKAVKTETKALENLDRCFAYGQSTGNFLPLLVTLGQAGVHMAGQFGMDREEFQELSVVPSSWQAPSESSESSDES